MDLGLKGKTALITGASRGIGAGIARELAREGANVCLVARNREALDRMAAELIEGGAKNVFVHSGDLRDGAACEAAVAEAVRHLGRLDILVNNAGATKGGNFFKLSDADWDDGFALKMEGYVRVSRAAWPHLKQTKGAVINIVGISARTPRASLTIGGAVNAALLNFSKALAELGRNDGVRVNTLSPGHILTDRLAKRFKEVAQARSITEGEAEAEMLATLGISRFGRPEEIGWLTAYLASEKAGYIQGAEINIDGGVTRGI
ncbi:MAG: SDR family oxidoreductase [Pseudolabrys sp.]